jgi:N-acetylglucosamine kinase-like BadF-type ATPase
MTLGLGLDAGGGGTRWVLDDGARVVARGSLAPLSGHVFSAEAEARARAIIADLAAAVLPHGGPAAVLAGITGTSQGSPEAARLAHLLGAALGTPTARIAVTDDIGILHRARFTPGEGILVYAGTGSAACHIRADGTMLHVGGLGSIIDDGGSGFAIARDALRAVLRLEEAAPGSGWSTPLGHELAQAVGGSEWHVVRAYVYGGDRGRMAALAPAVAAAARANDAEAVAALAQAARELARLARVLAARIGPQPVALAGGVRLLHPLVLRDMAAGLGLQVAGEEIDAAAAAARRAVASDV